MHKEYLDCLISGKIKESLDTTAEISVEVHYKFHHELSSSHNEVAICFEQSDMKCNLLADDSVKHNV